MIHLPRWQSFTLYFSFTWSRIVSLNFGKARSVIFLSFVQIWGLAHQCYKKYNIFYILITSSKYLFLKYSQIHSITYAARFANFEGILSFSILSIIVADLLGNTCLLVIGAFRYNLFVSVFHGSLLVITLFWAIID